MTETKEVTTESEQGNKRSGPAGGRGRGRRAVFVLFLITVAVAGTLVVLAYRGGRIVTDDAYVHATVYSVQTRVPGTVLEVRVEDNQQVESGQVLVRLDPEEPEIRVRLAEGALAGARMRFEEAQIAVQAADAEVKLVGARLALAGKDLARIEALWKKKTVSEDRYDQAVTRHRVLSSQRSVAEAKNSLSRTRIETSRTAVDVAKDRLAEAKLQLGYTEIRAPGNGIVSKKDVEPGMVVPAGTPLLALVDLKDLWVEANFKENQLRRIRPGLKAEVEVDTYPGSVLPGAVESIEAGSGGAFSLFPPENATGNWVKVVQRIPVKVVLEGDAPGEAGRPLRVGMSADVTIFPEEKTPLARFFSFLPGM
jgi:membrane fusion protein, multidrug efflux system